MKCSTPVHLTGVAVAAVSLAVWVATGAEGYTRWPNKRLERADAPPAAGEGDLLAEAGFSTGDGAATRPNIQSRFALGLVPGGTDPLHLISVATFAAAAAAASGTAIVLRTRRPARPR